MADISVIFASRGRPESLQAATESLIQRAARAAQIEIIVAVDPDDEKTQALARAELLPWPVRIWVARERYGYTNLHVYLNALAQQATGEWLMWFNDDMRVKTSYWDDAIINHRPAVLWPFANHAHHANIAPIWPRTWADALGWASPTTHMDTYLQRLGEALGRHDRVAIEITHDRADVTGNHDDQTYAEGRKLLGSEGMAPGWDEKWFTERVAADADVIRQLLS